jgi:hypothetical protein
MGMWVYTNLRAHVTSQHPEFVHLGDDSTKNQIALMDSLYTLKGLDCQ